MTAGQVEQVAVGKPSALASLLMRLESHQATLFGLAPHKFARIVSQDKLGRVPKIGSIPVIARTAQYFAFSEGQPGIMMLDYDPPKDGTPPLSRDELLALVTKVCPELGRAPLVICDSASSHIWNMETGEELIGARGLRIYVFVADASDIPRAGEVLFNRLWLAGYGRIDLSAPGSMLVRGPIDDAVWQPERLDFAAGARCDHPLKQRRPAPEVRNDSAIPLDTRVVLPGLTPEEEVELHRLILAAKDKAKPESARVRALWLDNRTDAELARVGKTRATHPQEAQKIRVQLAEAAKTSVLPDSLVLYPKDMQPVSVSDVIERPDAYDGVRFADPLDPGCYNDNRIAVAILKDGNPRVFSHAHGGQVYYLESGKNAASRSVAAEDRHDGVECESVSSLNSCAADDYDTWKPEVGNWPVLDRAALPGILGDFVDLATCDSEADPAAVLATMLVRFSVEACSPDPGIRPHVYVGESKHEPRIFAVIGGKSSKARKGTSGAPVERLYAVPEGEKDAPKMAAVNAGPLSTGEGIIFAVRDAVESWDDKEQHYKITDPGVADKRLYVQEEEFVAALAAGAREGNTLSATIRAFWDSGTRNPMTKTSRTKCTNAHVGILAHITLDELAMALSSCDKLNGYANRFLWILARRSKRVSRPQRMPDNLFIPIRNTIWDRLKLAHTVGRMELTPDAGALWDAEYDGLTEDRPGIAGAITARAEAQVVRLSMIYALCDGKSFIDATHVEAALAMWKYARASAEYIFREDSSGHKLDCRIRELLAGAPAGMSLTDIHKATGNNRKGREIRDSIQRLVDFGSVRSETVKSAGVAKPRTVFYPNEETNFTKLRSYSEEGEDSKFVNSLNSCVSADEIPDEVTV